MTQSSTKRSLWTKEEDSQLIFYWGNRSTEWISKKLGRTVKACEKRMLMITGSRSIKRGKWTQRSLAEETGFTYPQIRWAVEELGLQVKRPPNKNRTKKAKKARPWDNKAWLIDDEQADKIIEWLCRYRWMKNNKYPNCRDCGTKDTPHKGKGLCKRCHSKHRARRDKGQASMLDPAA